LASVLTFSQEAQDLSFLISGVCLLFAVWAVVARTQVMLAASAGAGLVFVVILSWYTAFVSGRGFGAGEVVVLGFMLVASGLAGLSARRARAN
jgi:hypothetical protein